jgi:hypothetical protein
MCPSVCLSVCLSVCDLVSAPKFGGNFLNYIYIYNVSLNVVWQFRFSATLTHKRFRVAEGHELVKKKVGKFLTDCTASQHRRQCSSNLLLSRAVTIEIFRSILDKNYNLILSVRFQIYCLPHDICDYVQSSASNEN